MTATGRLLGVATAVPGVVLAVRPDVVGRLSPAAGTDAGRAVARALGVRMAVQGVVVAVRPTSEVFAVAASVDTLHAASMLLLAGLAARYRTAAVCSAGLATGLAALAGLAARRR